MKSDLIASPSKKSLHNNRRRFLNSCIKIEEKRISRQGSKPSQVYFYLDPDIIDRISKAKAEYASLYLEPQQLTNLRYYSLINSPTANRVSQINHDCLSLVFTSNYSSHNSQSPTTVIRSTISFSGQIHQEIQEKLWQDSTLSSQVIQAHHWLTAEILRQLPLKKGSHSVLNIYSLWLTIVVLFTLIIWLFLPISLSFKLIIMLPFLWLLKPFIKYLASNYLKHFVIQQLTYGWLSNTNQKRQLGFKLLTLF